MLFNRTQVNSFVSRYHGLLYQEDGTLSLSRHVKACRVGQFHGEMFDI